MAGCGAAGLGGPKSAAAWRGLVRWGVAGRGEARQGQAWFGESLPVGGNVGGRAITENRMLTVSLPYPPSANRIWRKWRGRMVLSAEGRNYRAKVCAQVAGNGPRKPPSGGRIALSMDAFPPDRRRRDLDNLSKCVADALQDAAAFHDDSQIDLLLTRRRQVVPGGRLDIQLTELPLSRCPLCGAAFSPENN